MMDFAARCGLYCGDCAYRAKMHCPGCVGTQGQPFWGECPVAACCIGRGLRHCGQCSDFACDLLKRFAYDPEQGDQGERIRRLEAWNEVGLQAWVRARRG